MADKIRVALLTQTIDGRSAAGTALGARKCVEVLLQHRDEFELTFIHYEPCDDPIYRQGVREIIFPRFRFRFFNRRSVRQIWYFLTTKDRFDIVHWFQPRLYPFFWRAPARHLVVTVHGAGDVKKENPFVFTRHVYNWVLKLFKHKVTVAIVGSEYAKRDVIHEYGFTPAQVRVVNNGVDPLFAPATAERVQRVRGKYGLPEKFFLGVARLIPNKNVMRTLRAFLLFADSHGAEDVYFVNIGAQGSEKAAVEELIRSASAGSRIRLQGFVDEEDLPAFYTGSIALVFPLQNEGFGLPAIEAMACGTAAVISNTALPELTNKEAVLVDPLDEQDIARGMREVWSDPALRARLIEGGLTKARQFTWQKTGNKVLDIYRDLMR